MEGIVFIGRPMTLEVFNDCLCVGISKILSLNLGNAIKNKLTKTHNSQQLMLARKSI